MLEKEKELKMLNFILGLSLSINLVTFFFMYVIFRNFK